MKKLTLVFIIFTTFAMCVTSAFSRNGVEIDYSPVKILKNSQYLPLELSVSNFSGISVTEVVVNYRYSGESRFRVKRMENQGFTYTTSLNVGNSEVRMVEYYFGIRYADAREEAYPEGAPVSNLLRTAVRQMRNYGDQIIIISPEPDEQIFSTDIVITASFTQFASMVDVDKTKLYLDTRDISQHLLKYNDFITFAPRTIPLGVHKLRLELYNENSALVASREWEFTAIESFGLGGVGKEFNMTGRFFAEARRENLRDSELIDDYNQSTLQLRGNYRNFTFGGRFYLSNQEKSFRQPVNRYSGFARYDFWNGRYARANFGDAYPNLNPYIMQNVLLRGIHGTLFLKFMNLDIAYGKTNRSIEGGGYVETDSLDNKQLIVNRPGTYQRNIFAVRPSFGAGKNFQLGLTYLKGRDDTSSIRFGQQPKENLAVGMDLHVGLDKQRILFEGNVNASAYNRNISGGSIEVDTLEKILGEELSQTERDYYDLATDFITVNEYLILQPGLAYQARLRLRYFRNNFSFMFESVDEDYYSLGQPYLLRDNRGFHVVDNINLVGNQVFATIGFRRYRNNLQNIKNSTTTNRNIYFNVSYFPVGNLPEVTVGYNNYSRENDASVPDSIMTLYGDSLFIKYSEGTLPDSDLAIFNLHRPEDNQTNSFNISTGYRFKFFNYSHRAALNLSSYRRTDIYKTAESSSDYLALNLRTQYKIPLQTRLEFVLQQTETGKGSPRESNMELVSIGAGGEYVFEDLLADDRLSVRANLRVGRLSSLYKVASQSQAATQPFEYLRNNYTFRINYSLTRYGSIGVMADVITYRGDREYNDFIYSARYDYSF